MKFGLLIFIFFFAACTKKADAPGADQLTADQLVQRGKSIYKLNCISCHNSDPLTDGALGPAIFGSDPALLEARILHAKYPEGYKPKRSTSQMPALPHLAKEIPALHAFLNTK